MIDDRNAAPAIRILLVDDHAVVREGVRALLEQHDDMRIVGEAGDGDDALRQLAALAVDVAVLDMKMPGTAAVDVIARLRKHHPGCHVLVFTSYAEDSQVRDALDAGATGYLLKDTPLAQLADAVRSAARGETVLAPPVAARLVSRLRAPAADAPTARELEVLAGVARGLTNAEIGRQLFIGEATVKTHLLRVFAKLGVDDRTRAVLVAVERGLLPSPGR